MATMTVGEREKAWIEAIKAFDTITEASYRGHAFKGVLVNHPKALEAAKVLALFVSDLTLNGNPD